MKKSDVKKSVYKDVSATSLLSSDNVAHNKS